MIYVLTGENDFARLQKKQSVISEFVTQHSDLGLETFNGEESEFNAMQAAVESLPFLAPRKLVVLNAPGANKQFLEQCKVMLENVADTTDVLIDEPKFDKRSSYYKYCKKLDGFQELPELDAHQLQRWATDYVKKWQATIDSTAARELVNRLGANQLRIANELDKLCLFTDKIDVEAVEEMTVKTPGSSIFDLIDAALSGNSKLALSLYEDQRQQQVDPMKIIAMMTWQLHVLSLVLAGAGKSPQVIAKQAKLNPYVVQKSQRIASKRDLAALKKNVRDLRMLDEQMKSKKLNIDDALKAYIISL